MTAEPCGRGLLHDALAAELRRRASGESQVAIAGAMGLSPSCVGAWLRGDRQLYVDRFVDLCEAIGADPCAVLEAARRRVRETLGEEA